MPIFKRLSYLISKFNSTDKDLTDDLQPTNKNTETTRNAEMTDTSANVQPTSLVTNHPEEADRHDIPNGHDDHEERTGRHTEASVEDS